MIFVVTCIYPGLKYEAYETFGRHLSADMFFRFFLHNLGVRICRITFYLWFPLPSNKEIKKWPPKHFCMIWS